MKKNIIKISLFIVVTLLMVAITIPVNAVTATVNLTVNKTEVKPGETFTVVYRVNCDDGINGIIAKLGYDAEKLELTESPVIANGFYRMEELDNNMFSIVNDGFEGNSADIITLKFKAKTGAEGTAKITLSELVVDPGTSDSIDMPSKEVQVKIAEGQEPPEEKTIVGIEVAKAPKKTTYTEGENFDPTGMIVIIKYSDGSTKETTDYKISAGEKLTSGQKEVMIYYVDGEEMYETFQSIKVNAKETQKNEVQKNNVVVTGDNSISDKSGLPKTGASMVVVPMVIVAMAGIGAYLRYKNTEI